MIINKFASHELSCENINLIQKSLLSLDRRNMSPILEARGLEFPEAKRRAGFERDSTFLIAFDDSGGVMGYVEYARDWDCADDIHIASIRIDERYRKGVLLRKLLRAACAALAKEEFRRLTAGVHKHNEKAVKLCGHLGFTFEDNPKSRDTYRVWADWKIYKKWLH